MTTRQIVTHEEVWQSLDGATDGIGTAQDVAEDLAISLSTARRYLAEMVERGWAWEAHRMSRRRHYRRNPRVDIYAGW